MTLAACWTADPLKLLDAEAMSARLTRLIHDLPPISTQVVDSTTVATGLDEVLAVGLARRS